MSAVTLAEGVHVTAAGAADKVVRRWPPSAAVLLHAVDTLEEIDDMALFKSCGRIRKGMSVYARSVELDGNQAPADRLKVVKHLNDGCYPMANPIETTPTPAVSLDRQMLCI